MQKKWLKKRLKNTVLEGKNIKIYIQYKCRVQLHHKTSHHGNAKKSMLTKESEEYQFQKCICLYQLVYLLAGQSALAVRNAAVR